MKRQKNYSTFWRLRERSLQALPWPRYCIGPYPLGQTVIKFDKMSSGPAINSLFLTWIVAHKPVSRSSCRAWFGYCPQGLPSDNSAHILHFNSKSWVTRQVAAWCSQGLSKPMLMQTRSHTQPLIGQILNLLSNKCLCTVSGIKYTPHLFAHSNKRSMSPDSAAIIGCISTVFSCSSLADTYFWSS